MEDLLRNAPCGFVSVRDDGTIVLINETLASWLGQLRVDLAGQHVQALMNPGGRVFYQTHVYPLLRMDGTVEEVYLGLCAKDGSEIPVLLNGRRTERDGAPVNDFTVVRVRQRMRYEEELLAAKRNAEAAAVAKTKFLSMMSHDLRTPLTAIAGYAEVIASGMHGPVTPEQAEDLRVIREGTRDLGRMIGDILSFAHLESGRAQLEITRVPVAEAVRRAERLLAVRMAEAGLTVHTECADAALALADPDRLQQILLNLLVNASKFTPPGGRVTIRCHTAGDSVRIEVEDTGIGIPEEAREKIFDAFVQLDRPAVDPSQRGVGLGLAISRELTRAMGGELSVSSRVGAGSIFTIDLPAGAVTEPAPAARP